MQVGGGAGLPQLGAGGGAGLLPVQVASLGVGFSAGLAPTRALLLAVQVASARAGGFHSGWVSARGCFWPSRWRLPVQVASARAGGVGLSRLQGDCRN